MLYFNPYGKIRHTRNRLPHWQQDGCTYFVSFHLADSIPAPILTQWKEERTRWHQLNPPPLTPEQEHDYQRLFQARFEKWLDRGHGKCPLRRHDCAQVVADALLYFHGYRYDQHAWVVMPNHVHTLFSLRSPWKIERVVHGWKSFTAGKINSLLGSGGSLWQTDYHDRLIRNEQHWRNCVRYIRKNPRNAKLRPEEFLHFESEGAKHVD